MSTTLLGDRLVNVEADGKVIHGIAVPFESPSLVADNKGPGGAVRVYAEVWDQDSIRLPDGPIPLLTSHDETRPVGRIAHGGLWQDNDGVHVEATLSGSASEVEGIVKRAADAVMAGLSVGFLGGGRDDIWTSPSTSGGVPMVRRRGAMLRELSLVVWPALTGAQIQRVSAYTRVGAEIVERMRHQREEQHRRSQEFLAAHPARIVEEPTPDPEPPAPRRPRAFQYEPDTGAPILFADATALEQQLHHRALWNWAGGIVSRDR